MRHRFARYILILAMAALSLPGQTAQEVYERFRAWLAQQGWEVTGFDPAERAVAVARANAAKLGVKLSTEIKSYEEFDFGENRWDLILLSYVGGREMNAQVTRSLKPGGIVILEAFH